MKKNLQRHLKAAHNKHDSKGRFICQQETCEERFVHAKGLKQHYFKQHNIIIGNYFNFTIHIKLVTFGPGKFTVKNRCIN